MPLLLSRREWDRLRGSRESADVKEAAQRARYVKYLDQTSLNMTKNWPNSLENINRRVEESRLERVRIAEEANEKFYSGYMRDQRREQERNMERARVLLFADRDAPKTLLSAVRECATLKERNIQLEFQRRLKREKKELDQRNDDFIIDQAKCWQEKKKSRARDRVLANKEHQKVISSQIKECSERVRFEKEEQVRLEREDNENAKQQMADIKEFEEKFKMAERARIKADMEQASAEVANRLKEEAERDVLDEELRRVYLEYKHRVDCRRAHTEKELQEEKLRVLDNISKKLKSGVAARDAREQEIVDKVMRENEKLAEARSLAEQLKREQLVKERKDDRLRFLQEEDQRLHEEQTLKTWRLLNRCKNTELTKQLERKQRERDWRRTLAHREDLLTLWKERDDREATELAEKRFFYGELAERKIREEDYKLLRHAELVRQDARDAGQPTNPLDRAIEAYRRKYELYPARPLPASQQEHFPEYEPEDRTLPARTKASVDRLDSAAVRIEEPSNDS